MTSDRTQVTMPDDGWGGVGLAPLMARSQGRPEVVVAVVDGPVDWDHGALQGVRHVAVEAGRVPRGTVGPDTEHGTFVVGIMAARRGAGAPGLCPLCAFISSTLYGVGVPDQDRRANAESLARALSDCVQSGARIVNVSSAWSGSSWAVGRLVSDALDFAHSRRCVVVAATGNGGAAHGSALTAHPAVLPVVAYGRDGAPSAVSNQSPCIGRRGLGAPGEQVRSLAPGGGLMVGSGTSVAAPFVSGALALLLSVFPRLPTGTVVRALLASAGVRRSALPPLMNAERAYQMLLKGVS